MDAWPIRSGDRAAAADGDERACSYAAEKHGYRRGVQPGPAVQLLSGGIRSPIKNPAAALAAQTLSHVTSLLSGRMTRGSAATLDEGLSCRRGRPFSLRTCWRRGGHGEDDDRSPVGRRSGGLVPSPSPRPRRFKPRTPGARASLSREQRRALPARPLVVSRGRRRGCGCVDAMQAAAADVRRQSHAWGSIGSCEMDRGGARRVRTDGGDRGARLPCLRVGARVVGSCSLAELM